MSKAEHPVSQYFADLRAGIVSTVKGLALTFSYLFKKPTTLRYPEARPEIPDTHRGVHLYEEEKCALCMACVAACPVDCIAIKSLGRGKDGLVQEFNIDYSKCLFCNLCCEACNSDCLFMGKEYDLSAAEHAGCVLHFAREKSPEEVDRFKEAWAKREAEKKAKAEALKKEQAEKAAAAKTAESGGEKS